MLRRKWLVLWSLWAARLVRQPTAVVTVSGGMLRGAVAPDGSHAQYTGIHYATVNPESRFQAPGPELKWEGILDAYHEHIRCDQMVLDTIHLGQRECLILNVYTPLNVNMEAKIPVMFFIHGGAFVEGWSSAFIYGPRYLTAKGVILVTINYRLGVHGFMCLGIKEAPGNAGLKDQVAALKWIQRNIKQFGGDPNSVTIFGQSAGASSVAFHLLSPTTKALFHKAIIQSGSATAPWVLQYEPLQTASALANTFGYETAKPYELYNYFMTKTDSELVATRAPRLKGKIVTDEIVFIPCIEREIEGVEPYLTKFPYDVLSNGEFHKVPVMLGINSEEGLMVITRDNDTMIPHVNFEVCMPQNLDIPKQIQTDVARKLKRFYLGDEDVSVKNSANLSRWYGEMNLNYPLLEDTELIVSFNDHFVFNYMFKYDSWRNIIKFALKQRYQVIKGATHADDLFYLFSQEIIPSLFENTMIARMTTMWTNFSKYGDPTPEVTELLPMKWLPTNSSAPTALVIDQQFSTEPLWYNDRVKYLRHLYSKYRRKPK